MGGHSTVAKRIPSTTGSRIPHSRPTTQKTTTIAATMSSSCAEAMAILRRAACIFGPRPAVGAGAVVTSSVVSARRAPVSSGEPDSDGSLVRPGKRSLMPSIRTHPAPTDRAMRTVVTRT